MPPEPSPRPEQRLEVLDLLRGLALGGMLLVHFQYYTSGGDHPSAVTAALGAVAGFLGSAYTLFGFVFGASFGLQLLRAEAAGRPFSAFAATMARRLVALALVASVTEAFTGYHVLTLYVLAGFACIALARCSARTLVLLSVACLLAGPAVTLSLGFRERSTLGAPAADEAAKARRGAYHRMLQSREEAKAHGGFQELVLLQARQTLGRYVDPWSYVPGETAALVLLGLAAAKKRVLHALAGAGTGRRWLPRSFAAFTVLGLAGAWFWARWPGVRLGFKPLEYAVGDVIGGVLSERWLGFALATGLAWLTLVSRRAHRALAPLAAAGRMAITWYLFHVFLLELLLGGYWLHVELSPMAGLWWAVALYASMAAASGSWLRRHQYGPVEWLWRSFSRGAPGALARSSPS